jgi:hypothetical protein
MLGSSPWNHPWEATELADDIPSGNLLMGKHPVICVFIIYTCIHVYIYIQYIHIHIQNGL